jgi:hypothetical protein
MAQTYAIFSQSSSDIEPPPPPLLLLLLLLLSIDDDIILRRISEASPPAVPAPTAAVENTAESSKITPEITHAPDGPKLALLLCDAETDFEVPVFPEISMLFDVRMSRPGARAPEDTNKSGDALVAPIPDRF